MAFRLIAGGYHAKTHKCCIGFAICNLFLSQRGSGLVQLKVVWFANARNSEGIEGDKPVDKLKLMRMPFCIFGNIIMV